MEGLEQLGPVFPAYILKDQFKTKKTRYPIREIFFITTKLLPKSFSLARRSTDAEHVHQQQRLGPDASHSKSATSSRTRALLVSTG